MPRMAWPWCHWHDPSGLCWGGAFRHRLLRWVKSTLDCPTSLLFLSGSLHVGSGMRARYSVWLSSQILGLHSTSILSLSRPVPATSVEDVSHPSQGLKSPPSQGFTEAVSPTAG